MTSAFSDTGASSNTLPVADASRWPSFSCFRIETLQSDDRMTAIGPFLGCCRRGEPGLGFHVSPSLRNIQVYISFNSQTPNANEECAIGHHIPNNPPGLDFEVKADRTGASRKWGSGRLQADHSAAARSQTPTPALCFHPISAKTRSSQPNNAKPFPWGCRSPRE